MPSSESECTMAQPSCGMSTSARFSWMPSKASILKPHQSAHSRAADAFLREQVRELVGLDAVMERGDLEAELLREVEHGRHFIRAVAVDVHQDLAVHRARQRLELQVALRRLRAAVVVLVVLAVLVLLSYSASSASYFSTPRCSPAHRRTPGDSRRRCPCASSATGPCRHRRASDSRRTPSSGPAARREISSPGRSSQARS